MGEAADVKVWDVTSGEEVFSLRGHTDVVLALAYSSHGKRIVTGSADKTVKLWDMATGQEVLTLTRPAMMVTDVAFSPDRSRLGCTSADGMLRVWDARAPTPGRRPPR
jgi:WD40 repeat protein